MFKKLFTRLKPLDEETIEEFNHISAFIAPLEKEHLGDLLRDRVVKFKDERFAHETALPTYYTQILVTKEKDAELLTFIESINTKIREGAWKEQLSAFAKTADAWLQQHLAPQITELNRVKNALVLQIAAKRIHILLVGESEVTQPLLDAVQQFTPSSHKGTAADMQGEHTILHKAHRSICCLQDVQDLHAGDRTLLYTAMEHGYVKIDHGVHHQRKEAEISVLASVKPKGSLKPGSDVKKATGLDATFLGRFHLIFLLTKDSYSLQKVKPVSALDIAFVQRYISQANTHNPVVPIELAEKTRSQHQKAELTMALAKAAARLELRDEVLRRDIEEAQQVL